MESVATKMGATLFFCHLRWGQAKYLRWGQAKYLR